MELYDEIDQALEIEKELTVRHRVDLINSEIEYYRKVNKMSKIAANNDLPTSLPKKIALLYRKFDFISIEEHCIN